MSFHLEFEWADVAPSPDEFAHRTMAELRIRVNGTVVTEVTDHRDRKSRDHVLVPLHHVAEWLVAHWHHLFHEVADIGRQRPDFDIRHDLAFAGDGFVLPHLAISPVSGAMSLQWRASRPSFAALEFTSAGEARVTAEEMERAFRGLIEAVLGKFREENVPLLELEEAWNAINELDAEEQEFTRAAALLGVDPFDVDDSLANTIVGFWQGVPPTLREDALAGANADSLPKIERWLRTGLEYVEEQRVTRGLEDWSEFRRPVSSSNSAPPWKQGYDLARTFLHEIGSHSLPEIPHRIMATPSTRLQGLVASNSPACVISSKGESGTRFLRARAIGAYLASRFPGSPSLIRSLATDFQAFTRAFAAEFLAPAQKLREQIGGRSVDAAALRELARSFRVSIAVIRHQIENHHLARLVPK